MNIKEYLEQKRSKEPLTNKENGTMQTRERNQVMNTKPESAYQRTIEDIVNSLNDSCKFCPAKNCAICANRHKL